MLLFADAALNRPPTWIDIRSRMSPSNNNPPPHDAPDPAAQLAHELANLLDGSLRHLGLAIDTLSHAPRPVDPVEDDKTLYRLQTTDHAMRQMASLIHAWMKSAPRPRDLFERSQTLGQMLEQAVEIHRPLADRHGITLSLDIHTDAAKLPAGPMFPVIANAILNAIEAIAAAQPDGASTKHRINIAVRVEAGYLNLFVEDDGPGLAASMRDAQGRLLIGRSTKPDGHGLGLTLSQQIAHSLHGTLDITPRSGSGTRLVLRFPIDSAVHKSVTPAPTTTQTPRE
ncbi:MAG: HAMP domain-containing sensor histidine kinase [Phycisphaerales bacterium]